MSKMKIVYSSLFIGTLAVPQAFASVLNIDSMEISSGNLVRSFNPNDSTTPIALDITGNTNLVGGYINKDTTPDGMAISQTNFRMVKDPSEPTQYVYTAQENIRHNSEWPGAEPPADGTISDPSYVVPTGVVDDVAGTITMDLSSWFANHMVMNQNLGGIATGSWDPVTGEFSDLTWSADLTQGMNAGATVTWTLEGNVLSTSPVPLPGAFWLMGSAILGFLGVKKHAKSV
jgi:hypothetical protein